MIIQKIPFNLPLLSRVQCPISVDTPQHASGFTSGLHYPNSFNIYSLDPQHKTTTYLTPFIAFVALPLSEAHNFEVHSMVMLSHSASEPVLNISGD